MVREATKHLPRPPAIYGHNAGIGVKIRGGIWREVIDLLARLDGHRFPPDRAREAGHAFPAPYGAEWVASEETLTRVLPGIRPTMIARAGGLDQGNIILNLADAERPRSSRHPVPGRLGDQLDQESQRPARPTAGHRGHAPGPGCPSFNELRGTPVAEHVRVLASVAQRRNLHALREALSGNVIPSSSVFTTQHGPPQRTTRHDD